MLSNEEKDLLWKSYRDRKPTRVPMVLWTNPRVVIQNPTLNPEGYTFAQAAQDPELHVELSLRWQKHERLTLHRFTDQPAGLPEVWDVVFWVYNVYEAAYFGCPVSYEPDQVPSAQMVVPEENKHWIFDIDIERPLENPFVKQCAAFWAEMGKVCQGKVWEGRPVRLAKWTLGGTDGPVTVGCNLRGDQFLLDLVADPEYAERFMVYVTRAAILRRRAFEAMWKGEWPHGNGMADDSCAMLSPAMYREQVLPHHRHFYAAGDPKAERFIHLCGDATRLFPIMHEELNITAFDTGFPVDHGKLREQLGDDVEILGGPPVALLLEGTPSAVYERCKAILLSGVKRGGRFTLREGNNLPPNVPLANLEAMYQACLDHGRYDR